MAETRNAWEEGMMTMRRGSLLLMAAVAASGCEDSTGPEALDLGDLDLDVAVMAAEATLDDVQSMTLATWGIGGPSGAAAAGPEHQGGGMAPGDDISRTRTVTYYDALGAVMETFDDLLTASLRIVIETEGSVSRDHWSATIDRDRDMTATGLLGEEIQRTWNGVGSSDVSRSRHSDEYGDREYEMESDSQIDDVVVGVPRSEFPYPLSGTITRHVVINITNGPNGDETRERTVVITFDGDNTATMRVGDEEFEIDLDDRQGRRPDRKGHGG